MNSDTNPLITFDEAELQTLRAGQALSFREKLQWLEEAEQLSLRLSTCRVHYPDPANPGNWIVVERRRPSDSRQEPDLKM
jgi:hypothetical protein